MNNLKHKTFSWKYVFDTEKLGWSVRDYYEARGIVRKVRYPYMTWNGYVYATFEDGMNPIGYVTDVI